MLTHALGVGLLSNIGRTFGGGSVQETISYLFLNGEQLTYEGDLLLFGEEGAVQDSLFLETPE